MAAIFWGFPCVDPLSLRAHCAERGIPHDRWSAKANTFAAGPGPRYGRGWVLLKRKHLDALDSAATDTLVFSGTDAAHVVTLKSIVPVAQECVTPGSGTDPESVYLLEVADRRIHLARKPADRAFNLRKADGTGNYTNTLNSGSAWTWQEAVDALAGDAGLTTPLTLPFTPDGAPANLVYWGHPSALEALCDLLDRLACALCYDPTTDAFTVARLGESSVSRLSAADSAAGGARLWDGYSEQYDRAAVPETIRVRFPRRPVDRTAGSTPYYFVSVATGVAGATAGTVTQIDDDLSALAETGAPSNSAALATRAAERAADWVRKRRYYDQPVLRAWRDFVPSAAGLGGNAVRRVVFDDRAQFQTWVESGYGWEIEDWRPLGGWPVWWPFGASETATPSGADSCGWPAGADADTCIRMTVVSASGRCSGIDTAQSIELAWASGTSDYRSGASDFTGTGSGGTGQVILDLSGATPAATIDNVAGKPLGCSGDGGLLFAFGGTTLCGGTAGTCNNYFVARFDCECCSIAGWEGAGWYCVDGAPLYLTEEDRCDDTITIDSGVYETEAEAEAACPAAPTPSVDACPPSPNASAGQGGTYTVAPGVTHWFLFSGLTAGANYKVTVSSAGRDVVISRTVTDPSGPSPCDGAYFTDTVGSVQCFTINTFSLTGIVLNFTPAAAGSGSSTYTFTLENGAC